MSYKKKSVLQKKKRKKKREKEKRKKEAIIRKDIYKVTQWDNFFFCFDDSVIMINNSRSINKSYFFHMDNKNKK